MSDVSAGRAYITIDEMIGKIISTSRRSVEHWIARDVEGFATRCVVRRGGRVWIDVQALREWIEEGRA